MPRVGVLENVEIGLMAKNGNQYDKLTLKDETGALKSVTDFSRQANFSSAQGLIGQTVSVMFQKTDKGFSPTGVVAGVQEKKPFNGGGGKKFSSGTTGRSFDVRGQIAGMLTQKAVDLAIAKGMMTEDAIVQEAALVLAASNRIRTMVNSKLDSEGMSSVPDKEHF